MEVFVSLFLTSRLEIKILLLLLDTEAYLVPTDSSSTSSSTFLHNVTKNWSTDGEYDGAGVMENLNLEHFVDFSDDESGEDGYDAGNNDIEDEDILKTDGKTKKSMPNEEPHRKPLHPWFKTKTSEPTQKKARQDLKTFMESNSVKHEHKLVRTNLFSSSLRIIIVDDYVLG